MTTLDLPREHVQVLGHAAIIIAIQFSDNSSDPKAAKRMRDMAYAALGQLIEPTELKNLGLLVLEEGLK